MSALYAMLPATSKRQADTLGDAGVATHAARERTDAELAAVLAKLGLNG